jgi:hypothetical protein
MALPRKSTNCEEHNVAIELLKEKMEAKNRHDAAFFKAIEGFDISIRDINLSILKINHTLDHFKELPDKVRKLEDKSLIASFVEKLLWIAVGAFLTVYINENYIATRERKDYKIEKRK